LEFFFSNLLIKNQLKFKEILRSKKEKIKENLIKKKKNWPEFCVKIGIISLIFLIKNGEIQGF